MNRSRLGIKALGLCVLAVGAMAIGFAGVAQAEETGGTWTWSHEGKTGTFSSTLEASPIIALENNTASLLFTMGGGTKVTFLCTAAAFDEGGQLAGAGEILLGRIKFSGCVTFLNGVLDRACEPANGAEAGVILTQKIKGLMLLHKLASGTKDATILLEPDVAGQALVDITFGEECIFSEVPVTGYLVLWDCQNTLSTFKTTHLLEEFPGLHKLVALGQPATLSGSANVTLGGVHTGFAWGGTPN